VKEGIHANSRINSCKRNAAGLQTRALHGFSLTALLDIEAQENVRIAAGFTGTPEGSVKSVRKKWPWTCWRVFPLKPDARAKELVTSAKPQFLAK
jgi:hypothetical protein